MKSKKHRAAAFAASAAMALSSFSVTAAQNTVAADSSEYYLVGDCYMNDGVTNMDALQIQKYLIKTHTFNEVESLAADTDLSGQIKMNDAVNIMLWMINFEKTSHVGDYVRIDGTKNVILRGTGSYTQNIFSVEAEQKGDYKFRLKYENSGSDTTAKFIVNDEFYVTAEFPSGNGESVVVVPLPAGHSLVSLEFDAGSAVNIISEDSVVNRTSVVCDDMTPIEKSETTTTTTTVTTTTDSTTTTTTTTTTASKYYAAEAEISGGITETVNSGYEYPNGYANLNNEVGSYIEWTVNVPETGNYEADFRYSNGKNDDRSMQIFVNGENIPYYISFDGTDAWTTWKDQTVVLPLKAGKNTIKAVSSTENGGPNIDYIDLKKTDKEPVKPAEKERYYAVSANIHKGWEESTNQASEEKPYVNYDNAIGSFIEWNVNAPAEGNYLVDFRYANGTEDNRQVKLITNGDKTHGQYVDFKGTGSWTTWGNNTAVVHLKAGKNTLKAYATTSSGGPNMEYIEVSQTGASAPNKKATNGKRVEALNRGVSMAHAKNGNLVSWRLLATDNENTTFDLWRIRSSGNVKLGTFTTKDATNYFDSEGTATDTYTIDVSVNGESTEFAQASVNFPNTNSGQSGAYFDIQLRQPAGLTMPDGSTCTYSPNDCSVGDIDGDGQYEIFVKWDPSNSQDNSKAGYTGNVYIDCYRLDGKFVWRVDLGKNIRAGAHYTQFMVYDFDGDGKCEMICKTSDGTVDGTGQVIGDGSKDYRASNGYILKGNEYITLFDGATGKALDTQNYKPGRGNVGDWGDTYGNRVDRFTACVAYLDGVNPFACFGRGYYTRSTVAAYGVANGKLYEKWFYDTGNNKASAGYGDGNHHIMGADVDQDGKDEVVVGSAVIDDNGKLLYTSGMAHGDAIHIGDFDPANPGIEIFQCLEDKTSPMSDGHWIGYGTVLRDGKTGKVLYRQEAEGDTGRCMADNLITGNGGAEMVGSHNSVVYSATGNHAKVCNWSDITKWGQNSVVYWTDVCERAVLDRTMADQYGKGRVFSGDGVSYNNYTKSNACITCDLIGDWREEMLFPCGTDKIRVFTTTFSTEYNHYTLMHNPQYRVQVAAQNNGYNQPPHTDYYIDSTDYVRPEEPDVWTIK